MGFRELDPGTCWDDVFTFAHCCSIGDHASECWQGGSFSEARCCVGPEPSEVSSAIVQAAVRSFEQHAVECGSKRPGRRQVQSPFTFSFSSAVTLAAGTWLRQPTGHSSGIAHSARLAQLLASEAEVGGGCPRVDEVAQEQHGTQRMSSEGERALGEENGSETELLLPAPPSGRAPVRTGAMLEPMPQKESIGGKNFQRELVEDRAGLLALSLEELAHRSEHPLLAPDLVPLASASSSVHSMRRLASAFSALRRKGARSKAASTGAPAPPPWKPPGGWGAPPSPPPFASATPHHWVRATAEGLQALQVGAAIRIGQQVGHEYAIAPLDEAIVTDVLSVDATLQLEGDGEPRSQVLHRLRFEGRRGSPPSYRIVDLSQPGWTVEVPSQTPGDGSGSASQTGAASADRPSWPECVRQGETLRGLGGAGVFVNLLGFGANSGCFREDCSYTDHFSCGSPASCARTCAAIRACRWWSFWASPRQGGTCWLRSHDQQRAPMLGSVTGAAECVPPAATAASDGSGRLEAERGSHAEPSLFELARGPWGLGPRRPAHQWDLVPVLEAFGRLTPSQLEAEKSSPLQRSARRFARRAQRERIQAAAQTLAVA
eukprot:gnl/TRDRNA2_/TRDRNA2_157906_c2_seq1.p1 gnl/TRDRNA2_/TRDRNA2_157906_c2~~gnl/TRDRNA2_/TRDRNA2_157906_c2_seq1.p1  ORF type:complete len:603 (+),score=69.59 gnl/TRDRNA2_/TRDRNA2_157906_c2_seq1:1-1809(+)